MNHEKSKNFETLELPIERLGINGEGIGHHDGLTIFVEGALPDEVVKARITERKKRYGRALLESVITPSPSRITPPCPVADRCGGCQVQHLSYEAQCITKQQRVADALERIGKFPNHNTLPCVPSPSPFSYRNKVQVPIVPGDETVRLGFFSRGSHDLVDIKDCLIHNPLGDHIFKTITPLIQESELTAYNWKTLKGLLRFLIIRTAVHTNEALVIFVANGEATDELVTLATKIQNTLPEVKGVILNINTKPNNVVFGKTFQTLSGEGQIEEVLCGLRFKVSPASFFQVNPKQAEQLYQKVIDLADLSGEETVLDAYCGVGTQTLLLAQKARRAIGVECISGAIEDAKENALINGITNATFICNEAEKWIQNCQDTIDLALVNPPRKGCNQTFIEKLGSLQPKTIIYVSCDPATLARDLNLLATFGYEIDVVQPFDMFPQTAHVETVVKLCLIHNARDTR